MPSPICDMTIDIIYSTIDRVFSWPEITGSLPCLHNRNGATSKGDKEIWGDILFVKQNIYKQNMHKQNIYKQNIYKQNIYKQNIPKQNTEKQNKEKEKETFSPTVIF